MIKDIRELNFPSYATLSQATVTLQDMAEKTITSQVKIDGQITPDFSKDWEVVFKEEKYIMPLRQPQGAKENTSMLSSIDLTFQHWAQYQLKRWYFFTVQPVDSSTAVPDKYIASVSLNLKDLCILFGQVLEYYFGEAITVDLNPEWEYADEPTSVEISHSFIWDVLIKFHDLFAVRWQIEARADNNNDVSGGERYVIRVGYPATEVSHVFEYGFEGGLLKVERQVQDENIRNIIIGRGGEKNLPYRYFKKHDEDNATFSPDPDWIPELKDIYFSELHGATFRSYIQGWKAAHIKQYREDYPEEEWVVTTPTADEAYAPWAWKKGNTDKKFDPVEYVADEIVSVAQIGDRYVPFSPTYAPAVKGGSSIDRYGPLQGGLENNEEIYPTIQGVFSGDHLNFFGEDFGRVDEVVAVEIPEEKEEPESDARTVNLSSISEQQKRVDAGKYETIRMAGGTFYVPDGKAGNLDLTVYVSSVGGSSNPDTISKNAEWTSFSIKVYSNETNEERSASGIPPGSWRYEVEVTVHNMSKDTAYNIGVRTKNTVLVIATPQSQYSGGWYVWVKNIWGTSKRADETESQYAERVWRPILGDREGDDAMVVFSTGWLSVNEDYQFRIVGVPEHDESRQFDGAKSHWRIWLDKSDAELDAIGELIPNDRTHAEAGDHFFFIGIDMPHAYVLWAEERLDDWKKDELAKVCDIKPSWVVGLDKVRIGNQGKEGALIDQLSPGSSLTLSDKRFIGGSQQETLYLQSITYTYNEPTDKNANLLPDVEIVLSDKYEVVANPVATLQSEVNSLSRHVNSLSNISQVFRALGDKTYLRKDRGDRTPFPLAVGGKLTLEDAAASSNFAEGLTGYGWRIDKDGNIYADSLTLRKFLEVPELRYNRTEVIVGNEWQAPGAGIVESYLHHGTTDVTQPDGKVATCNIGWITLKLEDGEVGSLSVGDFCMGIWHFSKADVENGRVSIPESDKDNFDENGNSLYDNDDNTGNFKFAGFRTLYFYVYEVEGERNERLHVRTRSFYPTEPIEGLYFVAYGNDRDATRQQSVYRTRTYTRYLAGVREWTWGENNIMMQLGDLSGLSINGEDMSGYSAYLNNVYFSGVIRQIDASPLRLTYTALGDTYIGTREDGTVDSCVLQLTAMKGLADVTEGLTSVTCAQSGTIPAGAVEKGYSDTTGTYNVRVNPAFLNGYAERTLTVMARYTYKEKEYTASVSVLFRDLTLLKGDKGDRGESGKDGSSYTENLLTGTRDWDGWTVSQVATRNGTLDGLTVLKVKSADMTSDYADIAKLFHPVTKGETYTLSFWARGTGQVVSYCYPFVCLATSSVIASNGYNTNVWATDTSRYYDLYDEWRRFYVAFKADGTFESSTPTAVLLRAFKDSDVEVAGVKLERGVNTSPAWSPSNGELLGKDAVTYEWQVSPGVIRCNADGTLPGGSATVSVRCFRIEGDKRTELTIPQPPLILANTVERIQYSIAWEDGKTEWKDISYGQTIDFNDSDGRDTYPSIHLRVARYTYAITPTVEVMSAEHVVGYVCDGRPGQDGDDGGVGPAGAVMRMSGVWESGVSYNDGTVTESDGVRWIDVVYIRNSSGTEYWYRCLRAHKSSESNMPGKSDQWGAISNLGDMMADVLIANQAFIKNLSVRETVFVNSANKIVGRVGYPLSDGTIMYTGGSGTDNVNSASGTFRIGSDGGVRFGTSTGNRIEIDPTQKEINTYDTSGSNVVQIDGKATQLDSMYGATDNLARTLSSQTYSSNTIIRLIRSSASSFSLRIPKGETVTVSISVDARMYTEAKRKNASDPTVIQPTGVSSSVTVSLNITDRLPADTVSATSATSQKGYLEIIDDGSLVPDVNGVYSQSQVETKTVTFKGTFTAPSNTTRDITLTLDAVVASNAATVGGVTIRTAPTVSFSNYHASYKAGNSPRSHYGSNGLTVANSTQDYVRAGVQDGSFLFEAASGDAGLRVSNAGVMIRGRTGAYDFKVLGHTASYVNDANTCIGNSLGVAVFMTGGDTLNLPSGAATKYGGITTHSFSAVNHLQEFRTFSSPMQLWTRISFEGKWSVWDKRL